MNSANPPFVKGKGDPKFPQPRNFDTLKIYQRVVTFCDKGAPLRGTVRFTGDIEDSSGHVQSVVGLELVGIIPKVMDSLQMLFFPNLISSNRYPCLISNFSPSLIIYLLLFNACVMTTVKNWKQINTSLENYRKRNDKAWFQKISMPLWKVI